jgi:alanyl-tRNA synthetase
MTERLYYIDSATQEFDATVISAETADGRTLVRLDRTAFYPTSGGQPFDTGRLGAARVVDVFDETGGPEGNVVHVIEGASLEAGATVPGRIDWERRFDHMQQHTGQHILSAAFDRRFGVATVSFHMGAEVSTIDLARDVASAELAAAELEANRIVWEDRPVTIRFATDAEIAQLPLRKPPKKSGTIRLVDVEDWDLSACGGTHVPRTGMVGLIAVSGTERFKGGTRVEFVCGSRALARFRQLRDSAAAAGKALSVAPADLPGAIARLLDEGKEQRRAAAALQADLAAYRARELYAQGEPTAYGRLVVQTVDTDAAGLKALASAVTSQGGAAAVLVSSSSPALVVVARSADVVSLSANDVLAALTKKFGGRGGGKADLAQGGGLNATAAEVADEARRQLARLDVNTSH